MIMNNSWNWPYTHLENLVCIQSAFPGIPISDKDHHFWNILKKKASTHALRLRMLYMIRNFLFLDGKWFGTHCDKARNPL